MKTVYSIAAYILAFVIIFGAFLGFVSRFGMFEVRSADGDLYSTMPFTTQTMAKDRARQFCGEDCTVVQVFRK